MIRAKCRCLPHWWQPSTKLQTFRRVNSHFTQKRPWHFCPTTVPRPTLMRLPQRYRRTRLVSWPQGVGPPLKVHTGSPPLQRAPSMCVPCSKGCLNPSVARSTASTSSLMRLRCRTFCAPFPSTPCTLHRHIYAFPCLNGHSNSLTSFGQIALTSLLLQL
eukprot:EG_transcript_24753